MWWKKDPNDTLEWTVGEAGFEAAPEAEEPRPDAEPATPASATATRRALHVPWRPTALLIVAPTMLILLGVWVWSQWNQWQTRREVEQALSAARTAPLSPLSYLTWDETEPVRVGTVTQLDVNTLRADAVHTFRAPDGKKYRFATPRFFRRAGESWLPADPPSSFPGELRQLTNLRLTLYYHAADAELVEQTLLPYLNATLERICARWSCAKPATLLLTEVRASRLAPPDTLLEAGEPLLFWLLAGADAQSLSEGTRNVAAPHTAGYPVDAASIELWQRTLALQAFSQLALTEAFPEASPGYAPESPFLQTLLSLEAVNYGLEPPAIREYGLGAESTEPLRRLLESAQYSSGRGVEAVTQRRGLLTLLNRFTQRWPEAGTFDFTREGFLAQFGAGPMSWMLRRSLRDGQPFDEWVNQWRELLGQPASAVELPSGNLLLHCFAGPQFYQSGELKPLLPLEELREVAFSFAAWSPSGRYLPLGIGFRASVLDTQTGLMRLPPDDSGEAFHLPLAWASDTMLAYLALDVRALPQRRPDDLQLRFFDLAEPERRLPPVTAVAPPLDFGAHMYFLSPDRQWAALFGVLTTRNDSRLTLELMPALGGQRRLLSQSGQMPAWSPDSRELAFVDWGASASSVVLRIYTVSTGQTRVVWESQTAEREALRTQLAWSPDEQWIALAAQSADGNSLRWFGLVAPDGSRTIRLDAPGSRARNDGARRFQSLPFGSVINTMAFSRDGRYLALSGAFPEPQLLIYDLTTGRIVQTLTIGPWRDLQWSPDDRQLLLSGNGVALLEEPLSAQSRPRLLASGENCFLGSWKP